MKDLSTRQLMATIKPLLKTMTYMQLYCLYHFAIGMLNGRISDDA